MKNGHQKRAHPVSRTTTKACPNLMNVLLYEEWTWFQCLVQYIMYTMYVEVYVYTGDVSFLCTVSLKYHVGWAVLWPNVIFAPKFFARQVPKLSCNIIHTVQYFSNNNVFESVNENKRTSPTMPFGYGKLKTKRKKKIIPPLRKREVKNMNKK